MSVHLPSYPSSLVSSSFTLSYSLTVTPSYKLYFRTYIHAYTTHTQYHLYMIALIIMGLALAVFKKVSSLVCLVQRCHQSNIFQVAGSTNKQLTNTFKFPQVSSQCVGSHMSLNNVFFILPPTTINTDSR